MKQDAKVSCFFTPMRLSSTLRLFYLLCAFMLLVLLASISCNKKDNTEECAPSYSETIQPLIHAKCATAGCHDGSTTLPNFQDSATIKERADNGRIQQFVFDLKIMPPANATPLTGQEKEQLKCWLQNGAAVN